MIVSSDFLKEFIHSQDGGIEGFAKTYGISRPTVYKLISGEAVSNETMSTILKKTGLELSKAFEVKNALDKQK